MHEAEHAVWRRPQTQRQGRVPTLAGPACQVMTLMTTANRLRPQPLGPAAAPAQTDRPSAEAHIRQINDCTCRACMQAVQALR